MDIIAINRKFKELKSKIKGWGNENPQDRIEELKE